MFKKILVAVDGSHTSALALQEAIKLGKELNSQLRVIHVVDRLSLNWPEGGSINGIAEALRHAGQQIIAKAERELQQAGVNGDTHLLENEKVGYRVAEVIANEATTWSADLIIIGSHGRRGVSHLLLGSVAEGVARVSRTPLLIIRGK